MRLAAFVIVLAFVALSVPSTRAAGPATAVTCFGAGSNTATAYNVTVGSQVGGGLYSWPTVAGDTLVLVAHGYGGSAFTMGSTLTQLSGAGAVAVALDFRGASSVYKVFAGAEDTAAAVADLRAQCPNLTRVVLWGQSMGGHISALAVMQHPGLASYLVDDVGPTDIPELLATVVPGDVVWGATYGARESNEKFSPDPCKDPTSTGSANACTGGVGLLQAIAAAYAGHEADLVSSSPALNPTAWSGAGLARAYLLYEAGDTIVPPDHGVQLQGVLASQGVPVTMYTVPFRGTLHSVDPSNPSLYPNGVDGLGLPDHQSAGKELTLRIIAKQLSPTAPAVMSGTYTPEAGDPVPYSTVRTGNAAADGALAPAYAKADPSIHSAQGIVGKFTPGP